MTPAIRGACGASVFVAATLFGDSAVRAELLGLTAAAQSRTDEITLGQSTSFETALEDFPETSNLLPIRAQTALSREADGHVAAQGRGLAIFRENVFLVGPLGLFGPNPNEIGVSAASFSRLTDVWYEVEAAVRESRVFVLTPADTGQPIGAKIEGRSTLFISGGLVIWGPAGGADLSGAFVEARIAVIHRPLDVPASEAVELVRLTSVLRGRADGMADVTLTTELNGVPISITADVSPPSGPLVGRSGGQVLLPTIPLPFFYPVVIGEIDDSLATFTLEAKVEVFCTSGPGEGVGAGAVLGAPLFADPNFNEPLGDVVHDVANGVPPAVRPIFTSLGQLCGALGFESAMILIAFGTRRRMPMRRRRTNAHPFE